MRSSTKQGLYQGCQTLGERLGCDRETPARGPEDGEPGEQPSIPGLRCGRLEGRLDSHLDSGHRLMCLTDSDGFLFSSSPAPAWQMLQIDLFGGLWLPLSTDTLVNLCLSFPFLLTCPPAPGSGTLEWTTCLCWGGGNLIFLLVQRTRFVKNVNNRLLSRTSQRGRRPLPTRNASRVFRLLYL